MIREPFTLYLPARRDTATVFASPHSGRDYPADFVARSSLSRRLLRSSEDAFVDLLFAAVPDLGAPLLTAQVPRAFVDLNRAPEELDPALITDVRQAGLNPRVASGLGVIPRVVAGSRVIHPGRISRAEAQERLDRHWYPYHAALDRLLRQSREGFGAALLIDCHSMPHEAIASHAAPGRRAPEVVLGDRHGAACAPALMDRIEQSFQRAGFVVARNSPFAGAYVTQAYGRPSIGQHVVQVEIDRALYMDEATIQPTPGFHALRTRLAAVIEDLAALGRGLGGRATLAAE